MEKEQDIMKLKEMEVKEIHDKLSEIQDKQLRVIELHEELSQSLKSFEKRLEVLENEKI